MEPARAIWRWASREKPAALAVALLGVPLLYRLRRQVSRSQYEAITEREESEELSAVSKDSELLRFASAFTAEGAARRWQMLASRTASSRGSTRDAA